MLRCNGRKYRINMEVMSKDHTPNVLLQETIGILKPCFMVSKKQSMSDAIAQEYRRRITVLRWKAITITALNWQNAVKPKHTLNSGNRRQIIHLDSLRNTPLVQELVEKRYSDVFLSLSKPYKSHRSIKPNSTPAKHRSRKVPLHLELTFHDEVIKLLKKDVLESVED